MRIVLIGSSLMLAMVLTACGRQGSYSDDQKRPRDIQKAEALFQDAKPYMAKDAEKAEKLLRQALDHDLYHGPAHNNLGVLLLNLGKLYEAAGEFEWARKLMPGHPDPRLNLAIALERGGRHDDAISASKTALEVQPGYLPAIQILARIQLRNRRTDKETPALLDQIIAQTDDLRWVDWAKRMRLKLDPTGRMLGDG